MERVEGKETFQNDDAVDQYLLDCHTSLEYSQCERDEDIDECSSGEAQQLIRPEADNFQSDELLRRSASTMCVYKEPIMYI